MKFNIKDYRDQTWKYNAWKQMRRLKNYPEFERQNRKQSLAKLGTEYGTKLTNLAQNLS